VTCEMRTPFLVVVVLVVGGRFGRWGENGDAWWPITSATHKGKDRQTGATRHAHLAPCLDWE
jgi:hypothetical protein